jgi:hypothetical protein
MKVLVLSTTARMTAEFVDDLRRRLPADDLELSLVLVTRPAERLPVRRCLVVGPSLRPGRRVQDRPTTTSDPGPRPKPARLDRLDRAVMRRLPKRLRTDRRRMLATGVVRSSVVREEAARADVVVAVDYNATWAAWQLARRVPGTAVVFQPEGIVASVTRPDR